MPEIVSLANNRCQENCHWPTFCGENTDTLCVCFSRQTSYSHWPYAFNRDADTSPFAKAPHRAVIVASKCSHAWINAALFFDIQKLVKDREGVHL